MIKNLTRRSFVVGASLATCALAAGAALADAPSEGGASADGAGEGGAGGPGGGMGSSEPVDITGMLALKQYVFVADEGEVASGRTSCECFGAYGEGDGVRFAPTAFDGTIDVYLDADKTQPADGVSATVADGTFTLDGVDTEGNTAYYLSTGDDAYTTVIYVVNDS